MSGEATPAPSADGAPSAGATPLQAVRGPLLAGAGAILVFVLVFGLWGTTAPIAGGALAPGRISPEGERRVVQHLEGGIVEEIRVDDGDIVAAGDPLVVLRETQARADVEVLVGRERLLTAQRARLRAEQAGLAEPVFPDALQAAAAGDPEIAALVASQRELFARREALQANRTEALDRRIAQLDAEIAGLEDQIDSQDRRLALIGEEIEATGGLVERGLAPRPRLLALQREEAAIMESRAANRAAIARARQQIAELETQILALDAERLDQVAEELEEVQADLAEVRERLTATRDVLARTVVSAPIAGAVVDLRVRTTGGVIRPGDPILDIVPAEEALVIDARLSPLDVDLVAPGQTAAIRLPALSQRRLPRLEGSVIDVSADALTDATTGEPYYRVRVRVDRAELEALGARTGEALELTAGMPAEVLIVTGERTLMDYLTEPLRDSFDAALREG